MAASFANPDDDTVAVRIPRTALTLVEPPRCVSQRTSERVLGLDRRTYLALAREYAAAGGNVLHVGKLRIVEIDPLLAWMRARRMTGAADERSDEVGDLARELGLRAVAEGRRG